MKVYTKIKLISFASCSNIDAEKMNQIKIIISKIKSTSVTSEKHSNLLVYFIKKINSRGATHSAIVRLGGDFD